MKSNATIDWFEKPSPQAAACISFNCKGLISFNSAARQLLPDYVDLGYDRHTRILYLREGKKRKGLSCPEYFRHAQAPDHFHGEFRRDFSGKI